MIGRSSSGNRQDLDTSGVPDSRQMLPHLQNDTMEHQSGAEELVRLNTDEEQKANVQNVIKKPSRRHNQFQIQILESLFKDSPKLSDGQKEQLAVQLSLDAEQVRVWFQNKRSQMKKKQRSGFNSQLQDENQRIKAENLMLKNILLDASCLGCKEASGTGNGLVEEQNLLAAEYPNAGDFYCPRLCGRRNLRLLAERMVVGFWGSLHASSTRGWQEILGSGVDDVILMFQRCTGYSGRPSGIVVKASTSFGLPCSPIKVYDFLTEALHGDMWDVIFNGGFVHEITRINTGQGSGNCISVMQSVGGNNTNMRVIQETRKDSTGSLIVFAPIDSKSLDNAMSGSGNPNDISLLPSGFSVLPDNRAGDVVDFMAEDGGYGRSLVTVTYEILVDPDPTKALPFESVQLATQLVAQTVNQVKFNLGRS